MPITLDQANFEQEVLSKQGLVLVEFWAEWCGPCRILEPILDELADEVKDQASVGKLNVDDNNVIASKYGVMSIPTVILFKDGEPVELVVGVRKKEEYLRMIEQQQS